MNRYSASSIEWNWFSFAIAKPIKTNRQRDIRREQDQLLAHFSLQYDYYMHLRTMVGESVQSEDGEK